MTEPNELMLGNYIFVEFQVSEVIEIEGLIIKIRNDEFSNVGARFGRSECDPIPLSAAVLEACGFKKADNEMNIDGIEMSLQLDENRHGHTYFYSCGKLGGGLVVLCLCRGNYFRNNISYLHDLQNTHFIITSQPLEIDIDKLKNALK